jgi:hypothetical protein
MSARIIEVHNTPAVCGSCGSHDIWMIGMDHDRGVIVTGCRTCQTQSFIKIAHGMVPLKQWLSRSTIAADTSPRKRTRRRR